MGFIESGAFIPLTILALIPIVGVSILIYNYWSKIPMMKVVAAAVTLGAIGLAALVIKVAGGIIELYMNLTMTGVPPLGG